MLKNRYLLPPLDYLIAFESAASQESFTAAAKDLNISESAISRKVRLLELHFDCPLFVRGHRSIHLTSQGKNLLDDINQPLEGLVRAAKNLGTINDQHTVTLAATNSVASLWLMPRLQQFNEANKRIEIRLVASDNDQECLAENVDLAILRGEGNWPNYRSSFLFGESVFPVCSPDYMARSPKLKDLGSLSQRDLIEVSNAHTEWLNWRTWLRKNNLANISLKQPIVVNTYPLAIQAALDGLGICLGWQYLVDRHLESGQLVKPLNRISVETDSGYYLLVPENQKPFAERDVVENWLLGLMS